MVPTVAVPTSLRSDRPTAPTRGKSGRGDSTDSAANVGTAVPGTGTGYSERTSLTTGLHSLTPRSEPRSVAIGASVEATEVSMD
ncbi:hypothetical protein BH09ACT8_BH09ACT8_12030 [soil metagenome]